MAVCDQAIRNPDQLFEIEDLSRDARFYAGMPLVTDDGAAIGTVCVIDGMPRHLDAAQRAALQSLARLTMTLLDARARERMLEHTAFVATAAPSAPVAEAVAASDAPGYLLALIELQDLPGTVARLGERTTERLLQDLDATLEQVLSQGDGDALSRSSGSGEYVAVLNGDATATLARLQDGSATPAMRTACSSSSAAPAPPRASTPTWSSCARKATWSSCARKATCSTARRRHTERADGPGSGPSTCGLNPEIDLNCKSN